jgi:lipid II:glycine glycyltransferase (peptidoglycan interpeptide bridge formation enzyme)
MSSFSLDEIVTSNPSYETIVSTCEYDLAWDAFVASVPQGRQPQSSQWATLKISHGWQSFRFIVLQFGAIVGGAQVLIRDVPRLGLFAIVPHGPVICPDDPALVSVVLDELIHTCQQQGARCLIVQPPPGEDRMMAELSQHHFYPSPAAIAPTADVVLDLSHDLQDIQHGMRRQRRQNIRRSQEDGVSVRLGTRDDLHTFYELHRATAHRQGFTTYAESYYQEMWDRLSPNNGIQIFVATDGKQETSAMVVTAFGDRVYTKVSGWSGENPSHHPNEAVDWAAIQWAKTAGYHYFDFEGFDRRDAQAIQTTHKAPAEWHNTSSYYKYGFGGEVLIYPLAYYYIFNPALRWMVSHIAMPLIDSDSSLNRFRMVRTVTQGMAQRLADQERTRDLST